MADLSEQTKNTLRQAFDPDGDKIVTVEEAKQHRTNIKEMLNAEKNETPMLPKAGDMLETDLVAATRNELKQAGLKAETGREHEVVKILADSKREVIEDTNRKFFDRDGDGKVEKHEMQEALAQLKENGVRLNTNEIREAIRAGGVTMSDDANKFLESSAAIPSAPVPNKQRGGGATLA